MTSPPDVDGLLAEGRFAEALSALEQQAAKQPAVLIRRGAVLTMMGRLEEALVLLRQVADRDDTSPDEHAAALVEMAAAHRRRGGHRAHELATVCLDEATTLTAEPRLLGLAELQRGAIALREDDHAKALPLLLHARSLLDRHPAETVQALDALGACWAGLGDSVRSRSFIEHAIAKKRQLGDVYGLAISYGQLGRLCLRLDELDAAQDAFAEDLRLCEQMDDQRGRALCLNHLAQVALTRGDAADAQRRLDEAEGLSPPGSLGHGLLLKDRAELHLLQGQLAKAEGAARRSLHMLEPLEDRYALALLAHSRGRIALAQFDARAEADAEEAFPFLDAAGDLLKEAQDTFRKVGGRLERLPVFVDQAEQQQRCGQAEQVVDTLSRALECAETSRADRWVNELERRLERADPERWLEQIVAKVGGMRRGAPGSERTDYALGAESRFVVVVFADMVGFTSWSSERDAQFVVDTLNDYFSRMAVAIQDSGGVIDKYIGDGLMVLFASDESPDKLVAQGCRCALDMLEQLASWNEGRRLTDRHPFEIRLGINAGSAVVGNMGSYLKVARSAVGRTVNLAARLEALSEPNRILCGSRVVALGQQEFTFRPHRELTPKGLSPEQTFWLEGRAS